VPSDAIRSATASLDVGAVSEEHNLDIVFSKLKSSALGSSPHTDWGLLTMIIACNEPGLQILQEEQGAEQYLTILPRFLMPMVTGTLDNLAIL